MEDKLLHQAQQGDREAVESLFRREWRPVYDLLYRALGQRAEAEDLTQEVFIRALSSLERYQPSTTPFAGYLAVIARNLLRDHWRRGHTSLHLQAIPELPSPSAGPEHTALQTDEPARLQALLAPLSPDQQQVIRLRVLEGRPTVEVAKLMGRSPGAIRVLQHRALTTLRTMLAEGSPR